ncbi:MAG: pyruvate kinase alpha/beta domain-containing protein, partial [Terracidiphilus sp.]
PVEITVNRINLLWGTTPIRCPKVNSTEALVECAENLLEQNDYVRPREVIAIVAGTRTKSGSTNFMRLHVMGEQKLEGVRFHITRDQEAALQEQTEGKRAPAKKTPRTFKRYPSPNPPKISNP